MQAPRLSILMPAYNEANTILEILRQVQAEKHPKEIIIVDDGSTDGTREILRGIRHPDIKILYNEENQGKGYCLRRAIREATGDIAIIQDADLEYYPDEYGLLIEKIVQGKADVVYGSRFLGSRRAFHYWHYVGNKSLNAVTNVLLNTCLTDLMTCYKAFKTPLLQELELKADRFGIETEITAQVFRRGFRVYEVPISYNGRSVDEGKKIRWTDFFRCLYWLVRGYSRSIEAGKETLLTMTAMRRNNAWTCRLIAPHLGARVLELGAGIGTFSSAFSRADRMLSLVELDPDYVECLRERFGGNPFIGIHQADAAGLDALFSEGSFDTAVGINVLEHIEDDEKVLRGLRRVVQPGGTVVLLVPAHGHLMSDFDRAIGHVRRYTKQELRAKVEAAGFQVEVLRHMNALSAVGWYVRFILLKSGHMPRLGTRIADMLIPGIAAAETLVEPPFGLSLFCVVKARE